MRGKNLDGNGAVQTGVACAINLPHSARAERSNNLIGTESDSAGKGHECRRSYLKRRRTSQHLINAAVTPARRAFAQGAVMEQLNSKDPSVLATALREITSSIQQDPTDTDFFFMRASSRVKSRPAI